MANVDRGTWGLFVKNASANIIRATSGAFFPIIVTPFLTRSLSAETFGAWSLLLQAAALVGYLDFGLQTAVGRYVAFFTESGDTLGRSKVISTAFVLLSLAGILGFGALTLVALALPLFFPLTSATLAREMSAGILVLGASLSLGLPASVFNGVFIGMQRSEVPAAIVVGTRVVATFLTIVVATLTPSILAIAACLAITNLVAYLLQYLCYQRLLGFPLSWSLIDRVLAREIVSYCASLSIWSLAMIVISALDLLLVARFEYPAIASYAVAATLVTGIAALQNATFSALIPATAVEYARKDSMRLGKIVLKATKYGVILLCFSGFPLIVVPGEILRFWAGAGYGQSANVLLQLLVVANLIRLSAVPYAVAVIGIGQQHRILLTPVAEAITNLTVSLIAGYYMGALGVALGTLAGAVVGVAGNLLINMPRVREIYLPVSRYILQALARPLVCALPGLALALLTRVAPMSPMLRISMLTLSIGVFTVAMWRCALDQSERAWLRPAGIKAA